MKTKFLLSITMLTVLIFAACTSSSEDPYKGLIKKGNNYFLMIDEKSVPVDSGISYENALNAYHAPGALCPAGKGTKKVNYKSVIHYEMYSIYDGKKISLLMCNGTYDLPETMVAYMVVAVLFCILFITAKGKD